MPPHTWFIATSLSRVIVFLESLNRDFCFLFSICQVLVEMALAFGAGEGGAGACTDGVAGMGLRGAG